MYKILRVSASPNLLVHIDEAYTNSAKKRAIAKWRHCGDLPTSSHSHHKLGLSKKTTELDYNI
jgi:hypothetical protein